MSEYWKIYRKMDSVKVKSKVSREEKQATVKLEEQIEKVNYLVEHCF